MKSFLSALTIASAAHAFAPSAHSTKHHSSTTALHATTQNDDAAGGSRRQFLQKATMGILTSTTTLLSPQFANADSTLDDYATSIETSTALLSQSLGHALSSIDGLNAQARRLGSSPSSSYTHSIAVLDGMNSQAKRLINDLSTSEEILSTITSQSKAITSNEDSYRQITYDVSHATSVLDGLMAQSRRLVSASRAQENGYTSDEQIVYMLSVLDGLNAQARRLDGGAGRGEDVFKILDELNAKAAKALL
mmetsp:Transcript_28218/g.56773  ORF Transcript_28218/g.56773 Transcript_28218/m.56773 type:complete len:250 (+) Transcript_28218:59-808(+)|eukprot:CAMPEP_0113387938 /NCGR_PEP_ID=MMETSP0013_2-20120614/8814_1 /TAXON_ID=2843 ORGANISM="Skeletonema costatum, Strain 1716" /NCGR_SAMPLE_ID=MMETSP0013_2 /ASSEMBLY_ACC=CAM_ASM_000158 /LENGTH=249 /DNA_ID=CAMNT_0000270889 /DNA_START=57 /DNA_END=806 /DNA_ORIENTATION=+ /assembly_acc=CAM_ASM_000158